SPWRLTSKKPMVIQTANWWVRTVVRFTAFCNSSERQKGCCRSSVRGGVPAVVLDPRYRLRAALGEYCDAADSAGGALGTMVGGSAPGAGMGGDVVPPARYSVPPDQPRLADPSFSE